MAQIITFRGLRYNQEKAGSLSTLTAPPYDVIDEQAQRLLYAKNPYNVIRLEYGKNDPNDNDWDNRYTRANSFFARWRAEGILLREPRPVLYFHEQKFSLQEKQYSRRGLVAGIGLEDYASGIVLPHEETLAKAKTDRLELLRTARANFSPVFGIYEDQAGIVGKMADSTLRQPPLLDFTDDSGENHRLWTVSDEQSLSAIRQFFLEQQIIIADGHHRYETAYFFHKEMSAQGQDSFNFVLMTLVDAHDPGLLVLPTHRLVKDAAALDAGNFPELLAKFFNVTPLKLPATRMLDALTAEQTATHSFVMYLGGSQLYLLTLPRQRAAIAMASRAASKSGAWRNLDVAVLQSLILEELLGIDEEARRSGKNLYYTRDEAEALQLVDSGVYQAAFFLKAPTVNEVIKVARDADKMPQKSTYFYPKLLTGLVINDFSV
ncbi:MAG: hypothetical protein DDT21_01596 [Syntrophomonadaceae bacterium]|nr:hypothetical protein [Bacillota bacterium]